MPCIDTEPIESALLTAISTSNAATATNLGEFIIASARDPESQKEKDIFAQAGPLASASHSGISSTAIGPEGASDLIGTPSLA
jgi:hypothetical protein